MRTRLGSVLNVPVVLTSEEADDAIDEKLIETVVDITKQNGVMRSQIEVCPYCIIYANLCVAKHYSAKGTCSRPPARYLSFSSLHNLCKYDAS